MGNSETPMSGNAFAARIPSPLRHASNVSNSSSEASNYSENPFPTSRASTFSSTASLDLSNLTAAGYKRNIGQVSPTKNPEEVSQYFPHADLNPFRQAEMERESLRTLPQAPNPQPSLIPSPRKQFNPQSRSTDNQHEQRGMESSSQAGSSTPKQQYSMALSRSDSRRAPTHESRGRKDTNEVHSTSQSNYLDTSEIEKLGKSATGHLRALSQFAEENGEQDFKITSPDQEVVGMHGRRRLQRNQSTRGRQKYATPGYGGRTWMDQQRQFLQAYEYLCHIGEAKEWIEDIIHKTIPPIVQLEEALRDGVTLAEVVSALKPEKNFRIFRHERLQFRHSDNIAIFFNYLGEVELPELFRFELVDLYEKKNIPKVIYCIHALSWLLFRKGIVDFRIGNLVGQLEFEHHELEAMQKGLDNAAVPMPNFSGMGEKFGVEPEPEPIETEEEKNQRLLQEKEESILELQSQLRGALLRLHLGETMQRLWESEEFVIELQSRIRGDFARQIFDYRLQMRCFAVDLQSMIRGYLIRSRERRKEQCWKDREKDIVILQSLVRSRKARNHTHHIKSQMQNHEHGVRSLQAAIRGALSRWDIGDRYAETERVGPVVVELQTVIRGALQRIEHGRKQAAAKEAYIEIANFQALARGLKVRQQQQKAQRVLQSSDHTWINLQSRIRGSFMRSQNRNMRSGLKSQQSKISNLQAVIRGQMCRVDVIAKKDQLAKHSHLVLQLQSHIRAFLLRRSQSDDSNKLHALTTTITSLQALMRASNVRQDIYNQVCELHENENEIVTLQGLARAMFVRSAVDEQLEQLDFVEESVIELQALMRGILVRGRFAEKQRYYRENMQKVIKIQSFVRGRQQGEAYKSLTNGKNPPVGVVKNFVHLLNDSDFDFDEELESEKLQKALLQRVQENEQTEQCIAELDAKIGLLAHTKIASDEYARIRKHYGVSPSGGIERNSSIRDHFNLKALNKNARAKLERYQELFFILQTQPQYLARLFRKSRLQGATDKDYRRLETLVTTLFGFANKRREEYYLLKLIVKAIKEEVDGCESFQEFLRGNFFYTKLFGSYTRGQRDKRFIRSLFGPLIKSQIVDNQQLDLESDPLRIYRAVINDEELRTGQRSQRNPDIPREEAIKDPQTREAFIHHLQDLRDIVDQFILSFDEAAPRMPYGARYVAQQMIDILSNKFSEESQDQLFHAVGNWLWRNYFKYSLNEPESNGLVEHGLDSLQKRNLGEFVKVISQVAQGRLFDKENEFLKPLNSYVQEAIGRLDEVWLTSFDIQDAETQFDITEFNDLYAKTKPTLYIKMVDVFAIHQLLADELSSVCLGQEDTYLRELIRDLGNPKNNEAEMSAGSAEVTLSLSAKVHTAEDPDADMKALFMETKRCVLYIIRIQTGANLMDIMVKPVTETEEDRWEALIKDELTIGSRKRSAYSDNNNITDIASMSYSELKRVALENILLLERYDRLTRHNKYQDILNEIALDIRTKHRRRIQRQREIENVRSTITALDEKQAWLHDKLKTYNDTFEQNLTTLQTRERKKKPLPFTKQYFHEKELERLGRTPQYGSYKKSAEDFARKGILLSWEGHDLRMDNITVSSDKVNVFHIEGSRDRMMITGASAEFTWDDLLDAEYNEQKVIQFFDGHPGQSGGKTGVLRLDSFLFRQWLSKKFWKK